MSPALQLFAVDNFPLVEPGVELADLLKAALRANELELQAGDILVIAQKIVSKSEGRYVSLADVEPGSTALELADRVDKDPRLVELILGESNAVLRTRPGVIVVEHRLGYVHANAGIDRSNIPRDDQVLLLPEDPDASAAALLSALGEAANHPLAVIINDSTGRAWRNGTVGLAIGSAGIEPLYNQVGEADLFGRKLEVTEAAIADELAAAASFLMGQAAEGYPVVLIRGASWRPASVGSGALIRDPGMDLFR